MASLLKHLRRHPFPVDAYFEKAVAVSFAFPETVLRPLVPKELEIDTHMGFGFVTTAMVWTRNLRPAGFPTFLGQDFFLAGYRVFTRLRDDSGRRLRGLYILRSETDKHRMARAGNLFTSYRYRRVNVKIEKSGAQTRVETSLASGNPTLDITFEASSDKSALPAGSPFGDWQTARQFAGPMPFTFSAEDDGVFVVIEGNRQNWVPRPVTIKKWQVGLFNEPAFNGTKPIIANAFSTQDVSYHWKKGRIVRLGGKT
jgi:uncharacterized protein YqjF (DUF2071 family)